MRFWRLLDFETVETVETVCFIFFNEVPMSEGPDCGVHVEIFESSHICESDFCDFFVIRDYLNF